MNYNDVKLYFSFFFFLGLLLACVFTISSAFTCYSTLTYNWPNPEDCQKFYHCAYGRAIEDRCITKLRKFNPKTLQCDWAWKVDCTAVPHLPILYSEVVKQNDPPVGPSVPAHEDVPHHPDPVL
uniref:Chitin-binding type-2 domain-containing protein n=1 Tax=Rhodnius prolixus TaxID=13249 RepID=T1ICM3_RHOPR